MKLRCYLFSLLRIHYPDCEHCAARESCGDVMRTRLEELNAWKQPNLLKKEVHAEVEGRFDPGSGEIEASSQTSLAQQVKKAG